MLKKTPEKSLTTVDDLKVWLHRDLSRVDKLLLVLSSFDAPCQVRGIKVRGEEAGFRIPSNWNVSDLLRRSRGLAIRIQAGWEITDTGLQHLSELGIGKAVRSVTQVEIDLRSELPNINNADTRAFAEEAIKCHEAGLYRSAIVMSWMAAVGVLHNYVYSNHLQKFNAEARRVDRRWKNARIADELGRMKEADFLERLAGIAIIGKNVKTELKRCLDLRNSCGHPNSLRIGANTSAYHLEILILNVFKKF